MKIQNTEAKVLSSVASTRPGDVAYRPQFSTSTSLILDRMHAPAALVEAPCHERISSVNSVNLSIETASASAQSAAASGQKRKRTAEEEVDQMPSPAGTRDRQTPSPLAEITVGGVGGVDGVDAYSSAKSPTPKPAPAAYNPEAVNAVELVRSRLQNNIQQLATSRGPRVRCEKCARALSPLFNQLVLCSRCHAAWHQLCHEPEIDDEVVKLADASWCCAHCTAERSRSAGLKRIKFVNSGGTPDSSNSSSAATKPPASNLDLKKTLRIEPKVSSPIADSMRVSWTGCSAGQRRAYFATLSGSELIQLLMRSTELYPDLPIFPPSIVRRPTEAASRTQVPSRAGGIPQTGTYRNGIINSIRKSSSSAKIRLAAQNGKDSKDSKGGNNTSKTASTQKSTSPAKAVIGTQIDPDEEDPTGLMDAWPQPGQGLYATLVPEWEDNLLIDHDDSNSFSHIVYGHNGHKIRANGIILHVQ